MSRADMLFSRTNEKFRGNPVPGSITYYLENADIFKSEKYKREYTSDELNDLNPYLPRSFKNHQVGENPNELVKNLGWSYDDDNKKFYNKEYMNDGKYIYFDVGYLTWNSEKYFVPLLKEDHIDPLGITWRYDSVSTVCQLKRNNQLDYWNTRKGKRMTKYIEYRKMREKRAKMFLL